MLLLVCLVIVIPFLLCFHVIVTANKILGDSNSYIYARLQQLFDETHNLQM